MQVKATKPGYHIGPRGVGEVFEMPDGSKGSWFVDVTPKAAEPAPKAAEASKGTVLGGYEEDFDLA